MARKLQAEEVGGALRIGDCALRDPDSRVAVVTVDQMFHVLQRAAQTNPKLKAVDWAYPVPADPQDWEINPEALLRVRTNIAAIAAHTGTEIDPDEPTSSSTMTSSDQRTNLIPTRNPQPTRIGQKHLPMWGSR